MQLLLLRHAIAGDRDSQQYPVDSERPITQAGYKKTVRNARGMHRCGVTFSVILSSPFLRARQTAQAVQEVYGKKIPLVEFPPLSPGGTSADVLQALVQYRRKKTVILVGHEPNLSILVNDLLLGGEANLVVDFKKGGLMRIDFQGFPKKGEGKQIYFLTPKILRGLKRTRRP